MDSVILSYLSNDQLRELAEWRWRHEQAILVDDRIKCRGCDGCGRQNVGMHEPSTTCGFCKGTGEVANPAKKAPQDAVDLRLVGKGMVLRAKASKSSDGQLVFCYVINASAKAQETVYCAFTVDVATQVAEKGIQIQNLEGQRRIKLGEASFNCPWLDLSELINLGDEDDVCGEHVVIIYPRPDRMSLTSIMSGHQLAVPYQEGKSGGVILAVTNLYRVTGKRIWTEGPMIIRGGPRDTRDNGYWDWDGSPTGFRLLAIEEKQDRIFRDHNRGQLDRLTEKESIHGGNIYSPKFALITLEQGCEIHAHYAERSDEVPYPVVRLKWDGKELSFKEFKHPASRWEFDQERLAELSENKISLNTGASDPKE